MATFVLIHGAGDVGWYWHLVEAELRGAATTSSRPTCRATTTRPACPSTRTRWSRAIGDRSDLVVVAQSLGGFTAPLGLRAGAGRLLVLVAPMIPAPGEAPADYWAEHRLGRRGASSTTTVALFYQDVPPEPGRRGLRSGRAQSEARMGEPSPLKAWPDVPTRVLICRDDRLFPPVHAPGRPGTFGHRAGRDRRRATPALSRPSELADRLDAYVTGLQGPSSS